jgi:hypothetical protein
MAPTEGRDTREVEQVDVKATCGIGDKVKVLIGRRWLSATVTGVGRWSHSSGNSFPLYTVTFPDGQTIRCGNNSLRRTTGHDL